jgi:hypothetical protein
MTKPRNTSPTASQKNELDSLRAQLARIESNMSSSSSILSVEEESEKKIQLDDFISVMSLLPYNLNLSTKQITAGAGQGNVKKFTRFGEVKQIMYKDLVDIMEVNANFLNAGYFYIMDTRIIRQHDLGEVYSKILTKEMLDKVIGANSDESVTLYNSANEKQQEVIVEILIDKVRDNPDLVNMNVIDKISRASKVDISRRASDLRELDSLKETT